MRPKDRHTRRSNEPPSPNMVDTERYERLREILDELMEINLGIPVIVEGRRDAQALRDLGLTGRIITFHSGVPTDEFCNGLANQYEKVVILMDWDNTGEKLNSRLTKELQGQWEEHAHIRRMLRILCQKEIKDIEGIPRLMRRLESNVITRPEG